MRAILTKTALAAAVPALLATAVPAAAAPAWHHDAPSASQADDSWNHGRKRGHRKHRDRGYDGYERGYDGYQRGAAYQSYGSYGGDQQRYYGEPVYQNTRVWQGDDGRAYCRRSNGTTGLLIGGAAGALLGREVAGRRGDRTLGMILGGAAGALLGREVDRGGSRCR